jgi:hypothetical protein
VREVRVGRVSPYVMLRFLRAEMMENMTKTNKHSGFLNESMKSVKSGATRDLALTASAPQGSLAATLRAVAG